MLYTYKYVPHQMEQVQRFINFIFYQVWCRAPKLGAFQLDHFNANPKLKGLMTSLFYVNTQAGDKFYKNIEEIYGFFRKLERRDISLIKKWYQNNNDISRLCNKILTVKPTRYSDMTKLFQYQSINDHENLMNLLSSFFKNLYDDPALELKVFKLIIGNIDDHYDHFVKVNTQEKCPFCGFNDMLGKYHSHREAYDHYLPKALYPFNSINFKNLAPACHHCNSSYKTIKDPTYTSKDPVGKIHRRKAFYPYAVSGKKIDIEIRIDLKKSDVDSLTPADIDIGYGPAALFDEIETWKDVYGIEERYKAKCCSGDAKDWLEQVRILKQEHGLDPKAYLHTLDAHTNNSPFANSNFFKKAFLDGCDRAGCLDKL